MGTLGLYMYVYYTALYCYACLHAGSEDLHSDPHIFVASTLPTGPSSQAHPEDFKTLDI